MFNHTALQSAGRRVGAAVLGLSLCVGLATMAAAKLMAGEHDEDAPGAVYTMTNAAAGNAIAVFDRAADGTLRPAFLAPTGGLGTGSGLGNQGAVILSEDNRWLFAVNAGSNEITSFAVGPHSLTWRAKVGSGGTRPISLTAHGNVLYVLNAGGVNNITGFTIGDDGTLTPLAHSTRPLSADSPGPAEVRFSPDGDLLVVTEKNTGLIDTYTVDDGLATGPNLQASNGTVPFGFAFAHRERLIVSEAGPAAVSSYDTRADGSLSVITGSSPDHQKAPCWIAVTKNGKFAYTTNTGNGTVSGYGIDPDGALSLLNADGVTATTGGAPIDMAMSENSRFLYVLVEGQSLQAFRINADGSLTPIGSSGGILSSTNGLAAR